MDEWLTFLFQANAIGHAFVAGRAECLQLLAGCHSRLRRIEPFEERQSMRWKRRNMTTRRCVRRRTSQGFGQTDELKMIVDVQIFVLEGRDELGDTGRVVLPMN